MKKIILLLAITLIGCSKPEVQTQQPCMCNLATFYIPMIDQKSQLPPPELGRDYTYFENIELDCVTGKPIWKPTPNARFIRCEN